RLVTALGPGAIISMANIGTVYAGTRLDKALHLNAADLLSMRVLTGVDPLASPADTLALADAAGTVAAAGTTPADLRYLLRHEAENLPVRDLADAAATALLTTLQKGYQAAYAATRPVFDAAATPDENVAGLRDVLAKVPGVGEPELGRFVAIVDGAW